MRTLRQCLLDVDPTLLRVIASRWSIDPTGLKPRDLIAQLETALDDPTRSSQRLEQLAAPERDALRALLSAGGTLPVPNFTQRFGAIRLFGPARLEREQPWRTPANAAESLWYLGWLYRGFEQLPNGAMREVFIAPNELTPLLPLLKISATQVEPLPVAPTPDQIQSRGETLIDDLCTLLSYLHNNFARVQGRLTSVTLRTALTPHLHDTNTARFDFALHLAERARLIKIVGQRLRPDAKPSTDWLKAAGSDQLRQLFETRRNDASWPDLQHITSLQVERAVSINTDAVAIRAAVLDGLRAAVPNAWHTLDVLMQRLKSQTPDFLRTDFDTDYIRDTASGEYLRGINVWARVEGALIRSIIAGPLFWLGAIDMAEIAQPSAFRLTPLGAAWLGFDVDQPLIKPAQHFVVRADAVIEVAASRRYDRFQLARVADLIGLDGEDYRFRLTPSSLARAASQKIDAPKVVDFLTRAQGQGVPPSLAKAIQRWAGKGTEVKVERAIIVRVKDAAILKRLQESPKTRNISIEPLGPTAARINEKDWPKLVSILAEAGVLVD
ncbi:MAG: helicase-associated domain-containing protein [Chloroflexi bacterium]|nr:helicase-associated domain-containing protein [Chloroflexota bacterium]